MLAEIINKHKFTFFRLLIYTKLSFPAKYKNIVSACDHRQHDRLRSASIAFVSRSVVGIVTTKAIIRLNHVETHLELASRILIDTIQ